MAATGSGLTMVGIGIRIIRGAGRRFIMAVGSLTRAVDGSGVRIVFGDHHGFAGAVLLLTADGRRCRRAHVSPQALAGRIMDVAWGSTSDSASPRRISLLSRTIDSRIGTCVDIHCAAMTPRMLTGTPPWLTIIPPAPTT